MAAAPVWITESGSLGVVPEGKFYRINLQAEDPDFPGDPTKISYSLIAGALPEGVQVNTNGTIEGIPVSIADVKGVPSEVSENVVSKFTIRVTDTEDRIADRTFTLTVTGQDKPEWVTPSGQLGVWSDGTYVEYQLEATDNDPGDVLSYTVVAGTLPLGLTLSSDGLISGVADPYIPTGGTPGYDVEGMEYSVSPYDFTLESVSVNYQFTVRLTDGKDVVLRTFEIFIASRDDITADTTELTADMDTVTADLIGVRPPYIDNHLDDLGRWRHDNYFAYKFDGVDPDGEAIEYFVDWGPTSDSIDASNGTITADTVDETADRSSLPLGLTLDSESGWLSGYLPDIGTTERTYTFGVKVRKIISPDVESLLYITSMTIYGNIDTEVTWITDPFLGTIDNGAISTFTIEAQHADTDLYYRLLPGGAFNRLPQGLTLLPSGNIIGQTSFSTFMLDGDTTTFDEEYGTRLSIDPTTFDLTYRFTVEAYSLDNIVSVTREFTILINKENATPNTVLYCKALPPREDRVLINTLLTNSSVIPENILYRADDPNFGKARALRYNHAYGLTPANVEDYVVAMEENHYNKKLILGEIKTARALDANENVIYEVVYSQVVDTMVNASGVGPAPTQTIKYPALDNGVPTNEVHPNSLENMREGVIDAIGQVSKILPTWMLSKQEDGIVHGFTPAWVIAYTQPGKSKFLQYSITEYLGTQLNLVDFEIDRYTLDARSIENWDIDNGQWIDGGLTTFDRTQTTADTTQVTADDIRYTIDGWVQADQPPLPIGYVPRDPGLYGNEYETIFDGGSMRFRYPVDIYSTSDEKDKYIKFPKVDIIDNTQ